MPEANLYDNPKEFEGKMATSFIWDNMEVEDNITSGYPKDGSWKSGIPFFLKVFYYRMTPLANQDEISSSEIQDTITQEDLSNCYEDEVQRLIYQIRRSTLITDGGAIASRLLDLHNYSKIENSECDGIAIGSLRNFYDFICKNLSMKIPVISLTPDNNIYVSWRANKGRVFSIHFLANKDVRFVIFIPNDRHLDRKIRVSGTVTSDILMEKIAPYNIMGWVSK